MNKTTKYSYSEDLLVNNSDFTSIYDDVLFNHTITSIYEDSSLISLDDASDMSYVSQKDGDLEYPETTDEEVVIPSQRKVINPRRWETVKTKTSSNTSSYDYPDLVRLDDDDDDEDDEDDDLSFESKSTPHSVGTRIPLKNLTFGENSGNKNQGLRSRVQLPRCFPSYKDILLSKYFLAV